jgi:small subunit ribosomal protein S1
MNQNFAPQGQEALSEVSHPEEQPNNQEQLTESRTSMEDLLEEEGLGLDFPQQGEIRKGTVARKTETEILVSIGTKSEGVIPIREVEQLDPENRDAISVGKEISVYVVNPEDPNGNVLLSYVRALEEEDWLYAERLLASGDAHEGKIVGYNKGGLIVPVGQLRGFVPASQVSVLRRLDAGGSNPEQRWGAMVGEPINVSIIEVDRERRRLILSERVALQETRETLKERLLDELAEGDVRNGRVTSLADFGAFVNIDGADGLVHLSEIAWERIEHPREALRVGQEVKVKVIGIDRERKRIGLSIRQLQEDPWVKQVEHLKEGQLIEGTITHLTKFGAFARLSEDLEGLIHISELSEQRVAHPKEVVHEGDILTLRVIKIEPERHRIGLSLRKVDSPAYTDFDWKMTLAEVVEETHDESTALQGAPQVLPAVDSEPAEEDFAEAGPELEAGGGEALTAEEAVDSEPAEEDSGEAGPELEEEAGETPTAEEAIESEPAEAGPELEAGGGEALTAEEAIESEPAEEDSGQAGPVMEIEEGQEGSEGEEGGVEEVEAQGTAESEEVRYYHSGARLIQARFFVKSAQAASWSEVRAMDGPDKFLRVLLTCSFLRTNKNKVK